METTLFVPPGMQGAEDVMNAIDSRPPYRGGEKAVLIEDASGFPGERLPELDHPEVRLLRDHRLAVRRDERHVLVLVVVPRQRRDQHIDVIERSADPRPEGKQVQPDAHLCGSNLIVGSPTTPLAGCRISRRTRRGSSGRSSRCRREAASSAPSPAVRGSCCCPSSVHSLPSGPTDCTSA